MDNQVAGGLAGDIDPAYPGMEVWADKFFFSAKGRPFPVRAAAERAGVVGRRPPARAAQPRRDREVEGRGPGATEGSVQHVADIAGDWREEIVTFAAGELRIYARRFRPRPPRLPDAGSAVPQRRHPSLDGLPARADDQLLPGHAGGAGQEPEVRRPRTFMSAAGAAAGAAGRLRRVVAAGVEAGVEA